MNLTHKLWLTTGMYSHRVYEFPVIHELNPGSNGWETVPCNLTSDKRDTQTDKTMSHHLVPSYMLFTVISRFAAFSSVSSILLQFLTFSEYMYLLFQRFEPNRTISDLNYKDAKVLRQYLPSNITCMHWCLWVSENGRMTYWKQLWSSSHTTVCILFPDHINPTSLYQWLSFCVEVLETLLQKKGEFVSYFLFSSLPFVQCFDPMYEFMGYMAKMTVLTLFLFTEFWSITVQKNDLGALRKHSINVFSQLQSKRPAYFGESGHL